MRRLIAAPPQPELLEITIANRSSFAPAHKAALPILECPITMTRLASTTSSVFNASRDRLNPQAHAPSVPQSPFSWGVSFSLWNKACRPFLNPSCSSGSTSFASIVASPYPRSKIIFNNASGSFFANSGNCPRGPIHGWPMTGIPLEESNKCMPRKTGDGLPFSIGRNSVVLIVNCPSLVLTCVANLNRRACKCSSTFSSRRSKANWKPSSGAFP